MPPLAISPIAVTCPAEIARIGRQARNRTRERDPARRKAVRAWCVGKECSCGCGKPANTPHHPSGDLYKDKWADLSECEPYYHICHHLLHKGYLRCPSCKGWMRPGYEKCWKCRGRPGGKHRIRRHRHPCLKNLGQQRCSEKGVCPHSPRKAAGRCERFAAREART